jgi:S1-C subfamily serine protease
MYYPDLNNDPGSSSQPTVPNVNPQQFQQQSSTYPYTTGQKIQDTTPHAATRRQGPRAGCTVPLTMLLALLFGIVVFAAGWEFGHGSAVTTIPPLQQGSTQQGQTTIPPLSSNNIEAVQEAVVANVSPAVVQVNVQTPQGGAIGSGVIIDKRGYIVTNNHVVSAGGATASSVTVVLSDGSKVQGQVVGTDPADDLAVIKINPPAKMVVVPIGDSSKLQVGQEVLAIGNPLGITQTVTSGIVSALNRTVSEGPGGATIPGAIQTDAPINPGNSGGALVNLQGQLIGIPTLTAIDPEFNTPANGVGFAIPSNRVSLIVPQIIQSGHVTHTGRAALGVSVTDVTPLVAQQDNLSVDHGALIVNVVSGGAAANAGLQPGDVITKVGNTDVTDVTSLGDALAQYNPGQKVPVQIYRGNQQLTVNVTLGELQSGS